MGNLNIIISHTKLCDLFKVEFIIGMFFYKHLTLSGSGQLGGVITPINIPAAHLNIK
jgi:hypothetical protein